MKFRNKKEVTVIIRIYLQLKIMKVVNIAYCEIKEAVLEWQVRTFGNALFYKKNENPGKKISKTMFLRTLEINQRIVTI